MGFKIIRADEPEIIETINVLIYGEPGSGKTSLAFTAKDPILLDFDKGSYRTDFKKSRIKVLDWEENVIKNLKTIEEDFAEFQTIIIDTVETCLEAMGAWIVKKDSKYAMQKYKLQYYGQLKDEAGRFIAIMNSLGKDVIQIAHVKEKDEGDLRIKRPQITGGTYDKILQISDFVGYQSIISGKRKIDFNPTEFHVGKNSAKFDVISIPDFTKVPDFMEQTIISMKKSLGEIATSQTESLKIIKEFKEKLEKAETAESLNVLMEVMKDEQPIIKKQIWSLMKEKSIKINAEFHKAEGVFFPKEEKK